MQSQGNKEYKKAITKQIVVKEGERMDKRFREKHPILFNSIVAFIASLICNIILDWLMSI